MGDQHAGDATAGEGHGGEGEGHGGASGPNLFTGDVGNIFWSLLTFGAVIFVLGKFAWKPLLSALQSREEFIRKSLEQAKKDRDEAEARLRELEARLAKGREEASAIVEEGRRDAEVVRQRIESEARAEAEAATARARREIELARDSAIHEIYKLTADLAARAAGKILKKEIAPSDHEALIAESIKELVERN